MYSYRGTKYARVKKREKWVDYQNKYIIEDKYSLEEKEKLDKWSWEFRPTKDELDKKIHDGQGRKTALA